MFMSLKSLAKSFLTFIVSVMLPGAFVLATAPGGVTSNLQLWLTSDKGVNATNKGAVNSWTDQSPNAYTANTSSGSPAYSEATSDMINFHPVVKFDGSSALKITGGIFGNNTYKDLSVFVVKRHSAVNVSQFEFFESVNPQRVSAHMPWSDGKIYWDAGSASTNRLTATSGLNAGDTALWLLSSYNNNSAQDEKIRKNGKDIGSNSLSALNVVGTNSDFYLGDDNDATNNNSSQGDLAEIIFYLGSTPLSSTDRQKIESYLAIKYGITLDQSSPQNYIASDGSKIIDAFSISPYKDNIFGIGRDDASGLDQRISRSANKDSVLIVSTDNNFTLPNSSHANIFTSDKSFLMFSSWKGTNQWSPPGNMYPKGFKVLNNLWLVHNPGNKVQGAYIAFDVANPNFDIPDPIYDDKYYLFVDTDKDGYFTDETPIPLTKYSNNLWGTQYNFQNGQTFTIATKAAKPGGLGTSLSLWLRADTLSLNNNDSVNTWKDRSGSGNNATGQGGVKFKNDSASVINFNPVISFDGVDDYFSLPNGTLSINNESFDYKIVARPDLDGNANSKYVLFFSGENATNKWVRFHLDGQGGMHTRFNSAGANDKGTASSSVPQILSSDYDASANTMKHYINYKNEPAVTGVAAKATTDANHRIGRGLAASYFKGDIAEVIAYKKTHTNVDRQLIESYLAIKYGITLDPSVAFYRFSDGNTEMLTPNNAAGNSDNYWHDIAGIARDYASELNQQISKSVNSGAIVTISTDNNFTGLNGTHASLPNFTSVVIGNNGKSLATTTSDLDTNKYFYRVQREWRVQKYGNVSSFFLKFDGFNDSYVLLKDGDGDFTSGYTEVALNPDGSVQYTPSASIEYFTLAIKDKPPVINSSSFTIDENKTEVGTISATDPDAGDTISFTISGGADASLFKIDSSTGALSFKSAPDYENPADSNKDNVYELTVQATDSKGASTSKAITVTVNNVNEGGGVVVGLINGPITAPQVFISPSPSSSGNPGNNNNNSAQSNQGSQTGGAVNENVSSNTQREGENAAQNSSASTNQNAGAGAAERHCKPFTIKLKKGDKGEEVKKVQSFLKEKGFYNYEVTGYFGSITEEAVKAFQAAYADEILKPLGLSAPTGWWYPSTMNMANKLLPCSAKKEQTQSSNKLNAKICPVFSKYLKRGDRGEEVKKVQKFLKERGYFSYPQITGYFGSITEEAVKAFQEAYADEILRPWNLKQPTGWWYKTTIKKANELAGCASN